jgi:hypothetical protein
LGTDFTSAGRMVTFEEGGGIVCNAIVWTMIFWIKWLPGSRNQSNQENQFNRGSDFFLLAREVSTILNVFGYNSCAFLSSSATCCFVMFSSWLLS